MKKILPVLAVALIAGFGASSAAEAGVIDFGVAALGGTIVFAGGTHLGQATSLDLDGSLLTVSGKAADDDSGLSVGNTVVVSPTNLVFGSAPGDLGVNAFTKKWTAGGDTFTETLEKVTSINRNTLDAITVTFTGTISDTLSLFTDVPVSLILTANQSKTTISASFTNSTPAVPEPATWVMMALGFGALGYAATRRGKTNVAMLPV